MDFSIIVPVTRNDELKQLISALKKQDYDHDKFELIIVSFKEQVAEEAHASFKIISVISYEKHPGIKRNIGSGKATGRYYAFLDDDCRPPADWLKEAYSLLQEHSLICGPSMSDSKSFSRELAHAVSTSFFGRGNRMHSNCDEQEVNFYDVPFFNVIMESHLWNTAGGCIEKADYIMDDRELFYLLQASGVRCYNSPRVHVCHSFRKFPFEYLTSAFRRKFRTGINFFIYYNIFRKQPVFWLIYLSFILIPFVLILDPRYFLFAVLIYYLILMAAYSQFIRKDIRIYLLLPISVMFTNAVMMSGIFLGSALFLFTPLKHFRRREEHRNRLSRILE